MGRKKNHKKHSPLKTIHKKEVITNTNTEKSNLPITKERGKKEMLINQNASNLPLGEGAVIFLEKEGCIGHFNYLACRPLVIVKIQEGLNLAQFVCAECGSSGNLPGIKISLQGKSGEYLGSRPDSYIYPWNILAVSSSNISNVVGYVKPSILKAVREAMAWHLGFSDIIPPYMEELQKQNMVEYYSPNCLGLESPRPPALPNTWTLLSESDPPKVDRLSEGIPDDKPQKDNGENSTLAKDELPEIKTPVKSAKKIAETVANMTESEIAGIITCSIPGIQISKRFGVSTSMGYSIRKFIRMEYLTPKNIKKIRDKIRGFSTNVRFLSDIDQAVVAVYGTMSMLNVPKAEWNRILVSCRNRFGFNPDIGRIAEFSCREAIIPELEKAVRGETNQLLDVI